MSVFDETWLEVRDLIVVVKNGPTMEINQERNQLAAAAPEMYRVLKTIEWDDEGFCSAECDGGVAPNHAESCALAAALAKAEGR